MSALCPKCHQPVRHERVGVYFGPIKLRIFDLIKAAGDIGMSTEELRHSAWDSPPSPRTVKAHLWQINEALACTDWRLVPDRDRPFRWSLVRRKPRAA
jgi:hypothetical protein